jgi:alkylation response protein AidB-like acyl-CoA dehydrogenase
MAGGEAVVVLAHQERRNRYDPAQCDTSATEAGNGWTLTGQKCVVPVGDQADAWLVPARTAQGVALFLVDRAAAGGAACTEAYGLQDGGRAAELHLKDCPAALVTQNGTAPPCNTVWM